MNKLLRLLPLLLYVFLMLYSGCSGNDEPKPFDCSSSDLTIVLATNGNTDPTTCSTSNGSIAVEATGGKEPYKFKIGTGSFGNNALFSNLGAGVFTITVQDANKCEREFDVELVAPGAPAATVVKTQDTNCIAPGNATITVEASGGSGTYEYKLDGGAFVINPVFEAIKAGSHSITVRDDAGCVITINTSVSKGNTGVDYVHDILPIFQAKCQFTGCHPDNGDWFTYSVAKSHAADIKDKTASGAMPKSPAPGGSLSADQKALIACWVDDGAPQN
ncbi:unnamed protein product [Phaeothamnion confervicola]